MLVFGLALAFIPGLPRLDIAPELILPLILPPLLFAAARRTSWRQFLDNLRPIALLAVALVLVTTVVVGAVVQALIPGLPLLAALALGALVAPPDPVAATAVANRLRLPRRLTTILEGEGLSNDATSLVLYDVAVAGVLTGSLSAWGTVGTFALEVGAGVALGLLIALLTRRLLNILPAHPAGTALLLVMPFGAYAAADALRGSGVVAVVVLALSLSRHSDAESAQTRQVSGTTWEIFELLVTGAAFAFVGLELRVIAEDVPGSIGSLIAQALLVTAVVIVVRIAWIFPIAWLDEHTNLFWRRNTRDPISWRGMLIVSWSGMRGVVTLAAALALPVGDDAFPQRDRLLFIAFTVIVVTLLLQGLTLPLLVHWLGVRASPTEDLSLERDLTEAALRAAMDRLAELRAEGEIDSEVLDEAGDNIDRLWARIGLTSGDTDEHPHHRTHRMFDVDDVEAELLDAARTNVVAARNRPGADPRIVDSVLGRLDARSVQPGVLPHPEAEREI